MVGRRGGKSRAMATLAAYVGGLCKHSLVRGETGVVLLIAPDQRQAKIALDYCTRPSSNRQSSSNWSRAEVQMHFSSPTASASKSVPPASDVCAARLTSRSSPTRPRSGTATSSPPTPTPKSSTPCDPAWRLVKARWSLPVHLMPSAVGVIDFVDLQNHLRGG